MSKYPILLKENCMTMMKCPKYHDHNHYVFFCLSDCEDFKGIHDGCVICSYGPKGK